MDFNRKGFSISADAAAAAMAEVYSRAYAAHVASGQMASASRNYASDAVKSFVKAVEEVE